MPIEQQHFEHYGNLELIAKQVVEGFITGLHKSPFHGFSVEFAEHRLYNTGESTRYMDWKLYARTDKMFVKRFEEETNLRCHLVIDNSSSMYYPLSTDENKMKFSVYSAAAIIHLLKRQRDAYGLSVFSDDVSFQAQARSSTTHQKLLYHKLDELLGVHPEKKNTAVADALHQVAESIHKRSMVVIFSDMMSNVEDEEKLFAALQHLKYNKHEVVLFHVVDKSSELDFEFEERPYQFIDVETGEEVKLHPNIVREQYLKAIGEKVQNLKDRCTQYRIDWVEADIRQGFNQVLMPYLVKRERMLV